MTTPTTDDRTAEVLAGLRLLEGELRAGFQRGTFSLAKQRWCLDLLSDARLEVAALAGAVEAYRTCLPTAAAGPPIGRKGRL